MLILYAFSLSVLQTAPNFLSFCSNLHVARSSSFLVTPPLLLGNSERNVFHSLPGLMKSLFIQTKVWEYWDVDSHPISEIKMTIDVPISGQFPHHRELQLLFLPGHLRKISTSARQAFYYFLRQHCL